MRIAIGRLLMLLVALAMPTACTTTTTPAATTGTAAATTTTTTTSTTTAPATTSPPPPVAPRTMAWFDLDAGDCLAESPQVDDPNLVDVAVVDCDTPHRAEVFLRAPLAVNTAVANVADRRCADGFTAYTGESAGGDTYATSYLIDSNQNRTSSNPDPSTVICLLQSTGDEPLTASARR